MEIKKIDQNEVDKQKVRIADMQSVIDKMADYISKQDIDEDICKHQTHMTEFGECYDSKGDKMSCTKCIINYFKQEVGIMHESEDQQMNRKQIHKQVINFFGEKAQLDKALEELEELKDELKVFKQNGFNIISILKSKESIISELADVKNMIEQIEMMLGIKSKELQEMQDLKMIRTLERIKKQITGGVKWI